MDTDTRRGQTGSALIVLLLAALIIGLLWVAFVKREDPASPGTKRYITEEPNRAREAARQQDERNRQIDKQIDQMDNP